MKRLLVAAAYAAAVLAFAPPTATAQPTVVDETPLQVRDLGSFYVGGRVATISGLPERETILVPGAPPLRINPNGDFWVEQMYAQYTRLVAPRARYPLLMWHGGGLTGATWETTPDGRAGWQMFFLRAGHDVYVSDAMERGRSGWARFPEILAGEPIFRTMGEAWSLFRIGRAEDWSADPSRRRTFEGTRFPTAAYDQFAMEGVPRWVTTDRQIMAAYDVLVQRVCPCVIIVHSQGGYFGFNAALNAPDKVRALIALEPYAPPDATADPTRLREIPHLVVWGDYIEGNVFWTRGRTQVAAWQERIRAAGGVADTLDLPAAGIRGNSHMMMMDSNSNEVAARVQQWMVQQGLMR